jgi:UDP-glucose 4-epimerase
MARVIVSGGAGFIGSHLTDRLLRDGHEVVVIDDFSTGFIENLKTHKNLTVVKCDISNWNDLVNKFGFFKKIDCIFHLAAIARIQPAIQNPVRTHEVNVNGTFNILEVARILDIPKFIYSTSSSTYGLKNKCPLKEDMSTDCLNPYSVSKHIGEDYVKAWGRMYGIQNITLKYFNVYGARSPLHGQYATVIGLFYRQLIKEKTPMTIVGDGEQTRDFTYIGDAVEANVLALEKVNNKNSGTMMNIGCGQSYSINELARMIGKSIKSKLGTINIPPRPAEARDTLADISLANNVLGWNPKCTLEDGLFIMKNHYLDLWS